MIEEEEWGYLNDWEEDQLKKKRTKICMCCDHFRYACTVQCVTLLTCPVHQKLIPQGDHLIKGCKYCHDFKSFDSNKKFALVLLFEFL